MNVFTITRVEMERYKDEVDDHGLPDALDMLVVAVTYDRSARISVTKAKGVKVRAIHHDLCCCFPRKLKDPEDLPTESAVLSSDRLITVDVSKVPLKTITALVNDQQMRQSYDSRRNDQLQQTREFWLRSYAGAWE